MIATKLLHFYISTPPLEWSIFAVCSILLLLAFRRRYTRQISDPTRALSLIFTPSSRGRSVHLAAYFRYTRTRTPLALNSQSIDVDLSELLENIFAGNIELRDAGDLANLLTGQLCVNDVSFTLSVTRSWSFVAVKWIVRQQLHISPANILPGRHSQDFIYDLDNIQSHKIESELLRIQRKRLSGATFSIEFTCFAPGISFLSPCYILCLLPFLCASRCHQYNRSSVPLTLTLQKVIDLLSNDNVSILAITNISLEQAHILCLQEKDMVYNTGHRGQIVADQGLIGWRRKRFMLVWEAALLSARLLFRWRIILKAN